MVFHKKKETYDKLISLMKAQGYSTEKPCREIYLTDPQEIAPAEWQTEIRWLVE